MAGVEVRRPEPLSVAVERLTHGVSNLVRDHLELARVELKEGARLWGQDAAVLAAALGLVLVAHALLMVALALLLSRALPVWLAFALVGGANLGGGAALVMQRLRRIRARRSQTRNVLLPE